MALPFNPLSLVTPYTAVSTANPGAAFGNALSQARQSKVSEGYLQNTQHQTAEADKRYGQQEVDKARAQLDAAMELGNSDVVESALNNLRAVGARYGITVNETRSDAKLTSGVKTPLGAQKAAPDTSAFTGLMPGEDADKSQEAFEKGLIDESESTPKPTRYESGGKTTPEALAAIRPPGGSLPQTVDMGDVDSPEFRAAAAAESGAPVPGGSLPQAKPEAPSDGETPLQGYSLNGPDGKPLYSVAPRDVVIRQRQRVTNVFDGLASKTDDPQEKALIAQAQATAERLVGVRPIDDAVKEGLLLYTQGMQRMNVLKGIDLNHKGRALGAGGAPATMTSGVVGGKEGQLLGQLSDDELQLIQHFKANSRFPAMEEADRGARAALNSLNSANPASQFFAIRQLIQSMSGKTVGAKEEGFYARMSGLADEIANRFNMAAGEEMTPEYRSKVQALLQEMASYYSAERANLGKEAATYYEGRMQDRADPDYIARHKPYVEGAFTGVFPKAPSYQRGSKSPASQPAKSPGKALLDK